MCSVTYHSRVKNKWIFLESLVRIITIIFSILFTTGCTFYQQYRLDQRFGESSYLNRQVKSHADLTTWQDVRPIIEKRCVVCHGCYDAPCQLKLSSYQGVTRGASKQRIYNSTRLLAQSPTVNEYSNSIGSWREADFFPVLNERKQTPLANQQAGLIARMLELKQKHPILGLDTLKKKFYLDLKRKDQCPTIEEFNRFEKKYPLRGMPWGLPALASEEHHALMQWIKDGATAERIENNYPKVNHAVRQWENFLNHSNKKHQLMSRYLFEHLFFANIYFSNVPNSPWYKLVRSKTPPGSKIDLIVTRRPYDYPGRNFYYRLMLSEDSKLYKSHLPYAFSQKKMQRFKHLFINKMGKIISLPSYDEELSANPFVIFKDIPVKSRYQFLLDNAQFFVASFIKGPVCRGQLALNVINDHFWVFFVNPNSKVIEKSADAIGNGSANLRLPAEEQSNTLILSTWLKYKNIQNQYLERKSRFLNANLKPKDVNLNLIWDGDGINSNAALSIFRHFDSAYVGRGLVGENPKTAWIIDYPMFERIHYLLVAGFDIFGNVGHLLNTRLYMEFLRMEGEFNFLTLLPKEHRIKVRDHWYRNASEEIKEYIYGAHLNFHKQSAIRYKSKQPKVELYQMIRAKLSSVLDKQYNLNQDSQLHRALSRLNTAKASLATLFPESSFLLVKKNGVVEEVFTILLHKAHSNITNLLFEESNRLPNEDVLGIYRGFLTAYPNALFAIDRQDVDKFASEIINAASVESLNKILDRYEIKRNNKQFWRHSDELHAYAKKYLGLNYGLFDYSRLQHR